MSESAAGKLAWIENRIEALREGEDEPPCTCTRLDVDFYSTDGCESCDSKSEWNKSRMAANYQLSLHAVGDITWLLAENRRLRDALADIGKRVDGCLAMSEHIDHDSIAPKVARAALHADLRHILGEALTPTE